MAVSLPTHIDDPLERVRLTALGTGIAKENNELLGPKRDGRLIDYLPPLAAPPYSVGWGDGTSHNKLFNIPISNVAGPRERGAFGGRSGQRNLFRRRH